MGKHSISWDMSTKIYTTTARQGVAFLLWMAVWQDHSLQNHDLSYRKHKSQESTHTIHKSRMKPKNQNYSI